MKSLLERMISLFFEKREQRVKPLMYAQFTIFIVGFFSALLALARDITDKMNYWNYSAITDFMVGTGVLLIGIENFIVNKKNHKHYIICFICSIIFYWNALSYALN